MPKFLGFDHIDARVPSLTAVEGFYDQLFPALGFTTKKHSHIDAAGDWHGVDHTHRANAAEYFHDAEEGQPRTFIGIIEDTSMTITRTRIAFRVQSKTDFDGWEKRLSAMGARNIERTSDEDTYQAIFFEDPLGTRLELTAPVSR
jgi:catechol 2,3-dioxygenase-like lactoylglutathione lyase family enzyme